MLKDPFNLLSSYWQDRRRKDFSAYRVHCACCIPKKKKKDIETGEIIVAAKRLCSCSLSKIHCVFSAEIFPDFSMGARTRVDASEGCATMSASPSVQEPGGCSLRRTSVVNGRNLYDLRKQIIGATLTSRSITLGRTPTSAF